MARGTRRPSTASCPGVRGGGMAGHAGDPRAGQRGLRRRPRSGHPALDRRPTTWCSIPTSCSSRSAISEAVRYLEAHTDRRADHAARGERGRGAGVSLQALPERAGARAAGLCAGMAPAAFPAAARPLRDARPARAGGRDRDSHRERLLHAGPARGTPGDRRLLAGVLPVLRRLRPRLCGFAGWPTSLMCRRCVSSTAAGTRREKAGAHRLAVRSLGASRSSIVTDGSSGEPRHSREASW